MTPSQFQRVPTTVQDNVQVQGNSGDAQRHIRGEELGRKYQRVHVLTGCPQDNGEN